MNHQKLLQALDSIECDLRRLEGRLTGIRRIIYEDAGGEKFARFGMDGQAKQPKPPSPLTVET